MKTYTQKTKTAIRQEILDILISKGNKVGWRSKYIAELLNLPPKRIVGGLIELKKMGLVKNQQSEKTLYYSTKFPVYYWFLRLDK